MRPPFSLKVIGILNRNLIFIYRMASIHPHRVSFARQLMDQPSHQRILSNRLLQMDRQIAAFPPKVFLLFQKNTSSAKVTASKSLLRWLYKESIPERPPVILILDKTMQSFYCAAYHAAIKRLTSFYPETVYTSTLFPS